MKLTKKLVIFALSAALVAVALPARAQTGGGAALVCLDPGHGGKDPGAYYNGVMEKEPNLDIALRARELLESYGYRVIMTRETDVFLELQERCDIANNARADIFVSIHNNSYMTASEGTETYSYYDSCEGKRLATFIHTEVVRQIKLPDRGVKEAGFYVLKNTVMTAALVEGAFVSNPDEAELLQKPEFKQKIAQGVADGVHRYLIDPGRFDTFLLLQNPDPDEAAEVELQYMRGDGVEEVFEETVPAGTRRTIHVDEFVFGKDVSTLVKSTNGVRVIAERAVYFNFEKGRGGHGAPGSPSPERTWHLAEASTGWGFSTYLLIQNPQPSDNSATVTFMRDDGHNVVKTFALEPHSRFTLDCSVVEGLEAQDFAIRVDATEPVVTERAMYFKDHEGISGGHNSPGVTATSRKWYLAEGYTGGRFDTYLLLANPNPSPANASVTYLLPGGATSAVDYPLLPNSRRTVHVDEVPGLESTDVSFLVESDQGIIAERSMYFDYDGIREGSNSIGVTKSAHAWYLAEGYTGPGFTTYILLMNPNGSGTTADITFMLEDGSSRECSVAVPPRSRRTVRVNDVEGMSGVAFATRAESSQPLVVERAKYYHYGDRSGGDSAAAVDEPAEQWYFAEGCTR